MVKNSEEDSLSLLSRHNSILDTIRHSDIFDVKSISQNTNISWPTVKASLDTLLDKKVILANDDASKKYIINKSFCYSLGIAIGATETKIVLIDLSLMPANVKEHPEINEFITAIEDACGIKAKENLLPMQAGDVPTTYADVDELINDIGFKPNTSIEDGISKFVNWYKEYYLV